MSVSAKVPTHCAWPQWTECGAGCFDGAEGRRGWSEDRNVSEAKMLCAEAELTVSQQKLFRGRTRVKNLCQCEQQLNRTVLHSANSTETRRVQNTSIEWKHYTTRSSRASIGPMLAPGMAVCLLSLELGSWCCWCICTPPDPAQCVW